MCAVRLIRGSKSCSIRPQQRWPAFSPLSLASRATAMQLPQRFSARGFSFVLGGCTARGKAPIPTGSAGSSSPSRSSISSRFSARFGLNMALDLDDKAPALEAAEDEEAPVVLTDEAKRRQRLRSLAIAWGLFALALMFFLVTIVRLGANVANRPY